MVSPEEILADSPADFDTSLGYALHVEMRRLLIVMIVGSILLPIGLATFLEPGLWAGITRVLVQVMGLVFAIIGAALFYGGLVAIVFKIVTDAVIVGGAVDGNTRSPPSG